MKFAKVFAFVLLFALVAPAAWSDCTPEHWPKDGVYQTYDESLLPGRASEAWCTGAGPGVTGNTENGMSWDAVGGLLATQWHVWGMAIDENGAVPTGSNVDPETGNGWVDYTTNYVGGQFWLSKDHLWGDGTTDYTGTVDYYTVNAKVSLMGWQIVGVTSNVYFTGYFDDCTNCRLDFVIANAMLVWQTGWPNQPADFPPFLCSATTGEYFDVCCIRAQIHCYPTAAEPSTWGTLKALYR